MRTITRAELDEILERHELWLEEEDGGERADLSYLDLSDVYLPHANLAYADLRESNLCRADLYEANLYDANLSGADLTLANLRGSILKEANLCGANLREAGIDRADLSYAYLYETNLCWAGLAGAKLKGVKVDNYTQWFHLVCPEEGSFIGWKKGKTANWDHALIKLLIPEDAKRSSATSRECRASKAKVLEMTLIETGKHVSEAHALRHPDFEYLTGEYVYPDSFDEDRWNEDSHGIHFFMTKREACLYN